MSPGWRPRGNPASCRCWSTRECSRPNWRGPPISCCPVRPGSRRTGPSPTTRGVSSRRRRCFGPRRCARRPRDLLPRGQSARPAAALRHAGRRAGGNRRDARRTTRRTPRLAASASPGLSPPSTGCRPATPPNAGSGTSCSRTSTRRSGIGLPRRSRSLNIIPLTPVQDGAQRRRAVGAQSMLPTWKTRHFWRPSSPACSRSSRHACCRLFPATCPTSPGVTLDEMQGTGGCGRAVRCAASRRARC